MPRYYFNVFDGVHFVDEVGSELPSLSAARHEAVGIASDLLRSRPEEFWTGEAWELETVNECGIALFKLRFQALKCTGADVSVS